ncbi:MAG: ribosome rescue protein RqcH [Promethearchaeota archaeon]
MITPTKEFSNFDVFAIVKELDAILVNSIISNIYEIEDLLILKLKTDFGKKNLIIQKDARINLTEYDYPIPGYPSQYIRSLRKFLKNRRILRISQYKFDRIIILELSNTDTDTWKFIIELFNKGNFLLLDENNLIIIAKKYKKFKDRNILAKREYIYPKSYGSDFLSIKKEEFIDLFKNSNNEIVRDISRKMHISGLYSEEILFQSNVNKKTSSNKIKYDEYSKLFEAFRRLRNQLLFGEINAHIIIDKQGQEISVLPFELKILKDYEKKYYNSFNEAVDDFFSKFDIKVLKTPKDKKIDDLIRGQEKILKNQIEYLKELKEKKRKYYEIGDFIYANFDKFEKIISIIKQARKKGYSWEEINSKLRYAKEENLVGTEYFEKIILSTNHILFNFNDNEVLFDLKESIGENANIIYSKGKKAEKKIAGTLVAIEKTKENIEKLKLEKESLIAEVNFLIKKPKKKWYEKFRWFISSDGFLIIGGRDAISNEIIFKKYVDQSDLIFHTNTPGSPLTIIKNPENKAIPQTTIQETADFVASYSRAWQENWGVVDVFYVNPTQISKNPPSGEYLPKGSFIISGKKNIVKNAKTEIAIGLKFIELESSSHTKDKIVYPQIICGPESAVKKQKDLMITLVPSKTSGISKGKLAKKIKSYYLQIVNKELKRWVNLLSIDEILLYLPSGASIFKD